MSMLALVGMLGLERRSRCTIREVLGYFGGQDAIYTFQRTIEHLLEKSIVLGGDHGFVCSTLLVVRNKVASRRRRFSRIATNCPKAVRCFPVLLEKHPLFPGRRIFAILSQSSALGNVARDAPHGSLEQRGRGARARTRVLVGMGSPRPSGFPVETASSRRSRRRTSWSWRFILYCCSFSHQNTARPDLRQPLFRRRRTTLARHSSRRCSARSASPPRLP